MVISQGDVYWIDFGRPRGSEPGNRRPCVVVQNNLFNASRISTVVVAIITSNLNLGRAFGNVTLRKGEAGLHRKCVVNISQLYTADRAMLQSRIGALSRRRLGEVLFGIRALLQPVEAV